MEKEPTGKISLTVTEIVEEVDTPTGVISLTVEEPEVEALLSTEQFHLTGQHDQSSHGRGGGGGGGGEGSPGGGTAPGMVKSARSLVDPKEQTPGLTKAKKLSAADQKEFDDEENRLEGFRNQAYDNYVKSPTAENAMAFNHTYNELDKHRSKMYTTVQKERLSEAEFNRAGMALAKIKGANYGIPSKKIQDEMISESAAWWDKEPGLLKREFRGEKIPPIKPKPGAVKNGQWPKDDHEVTTIAQAGRGRRADIDGVQVKRAYEVTTADGTKIRGYDMSKHPNPNAQEAMKAAAYMHDLYPSSPPKKLVFLGPEQMNRAAGFGTNAFVAPGSSHVFIGKNIVQDDTPTWHMPSHQTTNPTRYTTTHELGHQFDFANQRRSSTGLFDTPSIKQHLSDYGRTIPQEAYAEAFAEWHMTQGKTTNVAARAYAKHNNWYGAAATRTAIAAALESGELWELGLGSISLSQYVVEEVEIDETAEWDAWAIARELGIITLAVNDNKEEDSSQDDPEGSDDDLDEEVFKNFPKEMPLVIENFNEGKPRLHNMKPTISNEAEREEAREIAREVYKELGLEYDEDEEESEESDED